MNDINSNIDDLLDSTLDSLADLPEFKIFPAGAYMGTIELAVKKMGDNQGVELTFKNQEVMELAEPTAEAPAVDATTSVGFILNNEFGQGAFKKVVAALKEGLGMPEDSTSRQVMEAAKGATCVVMFATRADKNDKTKFYQQLKDIKVA